MKFDATIRRIEEKDVRKTDEDSETGTIVIRDADGLFKATISGPKKLVEGFTPDMSVTVEVKRVQKTIKESVKGKNDCDE